MLTVENLAITQYEKRPRAPDSFIDERKIVASFIRSKGIYMIMSDMKLKDWFFEDPLSREVFIEYAQICDQYNHERAMALAMGRPEIAFTKAISYFMQEEDAEYYAGQMKEYGDYSIVSIIDTHIQERKREEAAHVANELSLKIQMNLPFDDCIESLDKFLINTQEKRLYSLPEIVPMMGGAEHATACKTHIGPLDDVVRIAEGGFLFVVGGESSSGKTSLTNQIAYSIAKDNIGRCMYVSTETDKVRLSEQRLVEHIQFMENAELDETKEIMMGLPNFLIDSRTKDVDEIVASIRKEHKSEAGCKFVFIDYLQNLSVNGNFRSQHEEYEYAVKKIHETAQELHIVIFLLAQLVKEEDGKQVGKKPEPTLSSFRGSSQVGNSADAAIILQTPEYGLPDRTRPVPTDCYVIKNKEGCRGKVELDFVGAFFTFVERGEV